MIVVKRNYNFDFLKAIAIILVIFWHVRPIRISEACTSFTCILVQSILNTFYSQITLIAVPLFYIVSIYLFYSNAINEISYFKHRMMRVFSLFLFWTTVQFILYFVTTKTIMGYSPDINWVLSPYQGGPDLPIVGGSVFYFLSNMLLLTCVAFFYGYKGDKGFWIRVSYILIVLFIIYFEIMNIIGITVPYWRIDNFIIYVPIVFLLLNTPNLIKYRYLFLLVYIVTSIHDIFIIKINYYLFIYARLSVISGAISLFCFIYKYKFRERKYVAFLSKYSLGIFAIHKYWHLCIIILYGVTLKIYHYDLDSPGAVLSQFFLISGVFAIMLTLISVYLLGKTPLKRFVS